VRGASVTFPDGYGSIASAGKFAGAVNILIFIGCLLLITLMILRLCGTIAERWCNWLYFYRTAAIFACSEFLAVAVYGGVFGQQVNQMNADSWSGSYAFAFCILNLLWFIFLAFLVYSLRVYDPLLTTSVGVHDVVPASRNTYISDAPIVKLAPQISGQSALIGNARPVFVPRVSQPAQAVAVQAILPASNHPGPRYALFCGDCGSKNDSNQRFCRSCGKPHALAPANLNP